MIYLSKNAEQFQVAEIELAYKTKVAASQRAIIRSSEDAYLILLQAWEEEKIEFIEQFKILLLNSRNKVLGVTDISTGGISQTTADPRLIFVAAIKGGASQIILAHNHPSGDVNPSEADINHTKKLIQGAKILDLKICDHLIITKEKYLSFNDDGLI